MINRRHIRIKVMQSIYATLHGENKNLRSQEILLRQSIQSTLDLYVVMLNVFCYLQKVATQIINASKRKYLATEEDLNPNLRFVKHFFFKKLNQSPSFKEYIQERKLEYWNLETLYIERILRAVQSSEIYRDYVQKNATSFEEDTKFLIQIYTEFIAPDKHLADFFEEKNINWTDDIAFVNTKIVQLLEGLSPHKPIQIPTLYKSESDAHFALELFRKTFLHHREFEKDIAKITSNWSMDRIAYLDLILIKMGMVELRYFSSIPVRVTLNEYIEISKEYATQKSAMFVNGILDKLSKSSEKEQCKKKLP